MEWNYFYLTSRHGNLAKGNSFLQFSKTIYEIYFMGK